MSDDLVQFLEKTAWDKVYWSRIKEKADELGSDGCSGVPDFYRWTCWEHDIHYRTHAFLSGDTIDKATADYIFRVRIQQGSFWGKFSPMSWWRWIGVALFGKSSWNGEI